MTWYDEYLQSTHWLCLRRQVLFRAKGKCEACGALDNGDRRLQVHHRTYERVGHERMTDLIA